MFWNMKNMKFGRISFSLYFVIQTRTFLTNDLMQELLDRVVNLVDVNGNTALHYSGIVNLVDVNGNTALHYSGIVVNL